MIFITGWEDWSLIETETHRTTLRFCWDLWSALYRPINNGCVFSSNDGLVASGKRKKVVWFFLVNWKMSLTSLGAISEYYEKENISVVKSIL